MDRFSRCGEQNDPTIPAPRHHLKILPIRPVVLALPVPFLWIALTYRTILPVVPASQPRLRSGGLTLSKQTPRPAAVASPMGQLRTYALQKKDGEEPVNLADMYVLDSDTIVGW